MANLVHAQVLGGSVKELKDVTTVADVKRQLNVPTYTATVNGEPAEDGDTLEEYEFVSLSPAVKGGVR